MTKRKGKKECPVCELNTNVKMNFIHEKKRAIAENLVHRKSAKKGK